jgi:hypothetical protein
VAQIVITPQARRDVDEAMSALNLPADTWSRIARTLQVLETFPLAGSELEGQWASMRFVLGPWSWMILLYRYDEPSDHAFVIAMHDARSATSARSGGP